MNLKEQIRNDMTAALKARESEKVSVLRMINSRILEKEVELRSKRGRDCQLSDEETLEVVGSYAKQRRQSIQAYREAGREDLALKEESELEILQGYLPRQLSTEEIERMVETTISECGATGPKDMGSVMRALMPKLKGAADGKLVNEIVRQKLGTA